MFSVCLEYQNRHKFSWEKVWKLLCTCFSSIAIKQAAIDVKHSINDDERRPINDQPVSELYDTIVIIIIIKEALHGYMRFKIKYIT